MQSEVESICVAPDDLPTVFPLIGTAPLGLLDPDELSAFLVEIQPIVEAEFAEARERLAALSPPEDLVDDHEATLTYFTEIGEVARRITEAAEAKDQQALFALFDESARPGPKLTETLSEPGKALFGIFGP